MVHLQRTTGREHDLVGKVHESNGVGAQQSHGARGFQQFGLSTCPLLARFRKTTCQHNGRWGATLGQGLDRHERAFCAQGNDGHIGDLGQVGNGGVAGEPLELIELGVDRVNSTGIAVFLQIGDGATSGFFGIPRGTDHSDTGGFEKFLDGSGHDLGLRSFTQERHDRFAVLGAGVTNALGLTATLKDLLSGQFHGLVQDGFGQSQGGGRPSTQL